MNRVIEIIRKLAIVVICGGLFLSGVFVLYVIAKDKSQVIAGLVCIALSFITYKVINWIFAEKKTSE